MEIAVYIIIAFLSGMAVAGGIAFLLSQNDRRSQRAQLELMEARFAQLSEQMLKERSQDLAVRSQSSLSAIVDPLKHTLEEMRKQMEENQRSMGANTAAQEGTKASIKASVDTLMERVLKVSESADRLSNALTSQSKVQGNWGERALKVLLDAMGFHEGVQYELQSFLSDASGQAVRSDTGHKLQPDCILHLDECRELIIDSKVSLTAYTDYCNADEAGKAQALQLHLASVRNHVKELALKNYAAYIQPPKYKVDYVMMFVPVNGAYQLAVESDPNLWRWAMEQNVFIVGEQNLYAALRVVDMAWVQIKQNANHQRVFELAEELVTRVGHFMEIHKEIGAHLEKATQAYQAAEAKATTGQSILSSARKLVDLGAKQNAKHPLPIPPVKELE